MSPENAGPQQAQVETFFNNLSKSLSRLKLYSLAHPMTAESVRETFTSLQSCLGERPELSVAWTGEELLIDGQPAKYLGGQTETVRALFDRYHVQSISFLNGVSPDELTALHKVLTLKEGAIKNGDEFKKFLDSENVRGIRVDTALYAKVTGDQPAGAGAGAGGSSASTDAKVSRLIQQLENQPVETMLWKLIEQTIADPEERKKVFELILKQLKQELEDYVRRATQKLEQEKQQIANIQERTESVIRNIADGTIVLDEKGQILMMNPAAEKIYGATLSQMKGKKLTDAGNKDEVLIALAKELRDTSDKQFSKEVAVQGEQDTQQVISSATAMIQNPDGKIVGIMSLLNDIAKQRELQRMQHDFMAHVTHELRTPLTAIRAALGTIFDDTAASMTPSQQQILTIANRNIERLARLINDLLDCAKIGAGKMTINPADMDPRPFLRETVVGLESWAAAKGVTLSMDDPGALPKIAGDIDRLTQVLVNLISNAIKFTPKGGSVKVRAAPQGTLFLKISVTDTGPGIPKDKQPQLFERFYQLKQTEKTDTPGTGLGLYIAKTLVELHKGQIGLESEEGKGSTFFFTVPLVQQARAATPAAGDQPQAIGQVIQPEKKSKGWLSRLFGK